MILGAPLGLVAVVATILWIDTPRVAVRIESSGFGKVGADRRLRVTGSLLIAGIVAVAAGGAMGSAVAAILAPVVVLVVGVGMQREGDNRQRRERLRTVPHVVDLLAQALRSGSTILGALRTLSRDHSDAIDATSALAEVTAGRPLVEALNHARQMPPLLRAALVAVERSGVPGAAAVERLADQLRLKAASESSARAQSGQQLASASVMAGISPVIALLYGINDSAAADFYLHQAGGAVVLIVSFGLSALSWFWMRWILVGRVTA